MKAGQLEIGEELETRDGITRAVSISTKLGAIRVYNLEVETDHCYFTGHERVLSHNACQVEKLTNGEIQKLKRANIDIHDLKPNKDGSRFDLFKDKMGNIHIRTKDGKHVIDNLGINIKDF